MNIRIQEIQQVFINLINNARHALNKKYPISHENKILEIKGEVNTVNRERYLRLTFHDRGIGIPEILLDKVGTPFFTTKPKGEGTGLGLSISQGIIKKHEGIFFIESKEDEYTKVILDLPF